jgi:hypothetical protein
MPICYYCSLFHIFACTVNFVVMLDTIFLFVCLFVLVLVFCILLFLLVSYCSCKTVSTTAPGAGPVQKGGRELQSGVYQGRRETRIYILGTVPNVFFINIESECTE